MNDSQMKPIFSDMVILVDSREKKNQHILDYFKSTGIKYRIEKLDTADYSFELPNYPELKCDRMFLVEKKNSIDEIVGNFTKDRERFVREFERIDEEHIHLVIENTTWKKILCGSYRSSFLPKSLMASILSFSIKYKCNTWFCTPQESPILIYNTLYYELRNFLKSC